MLPSNSGKILVAREWRCGQWKCVTSTGLTDVRDNRSRPAPHFCRSDMTHRPQDCGPGEVSFPGPFVFLFVKHFVWSVGNTRRADFPGNRLRPRRTLRRMGPCSPRRSRASSSRPERRHARTVLRSAARKPRQLRRLRKGACDAAGARRRPETGKRRPAGSRTRQADHRFAKCSRRTAPIRDEPCRKPRQQWAARTEIERP